MRVTLAILITLIFISCSAPKEIVKSNQLSPNCHCDGSGDFTIVMDAGMGNWSIFYQPLFQKLKDNNRVCIIDRPGYAMDSVTNLPRDLKTVATEIKNVLAKNDINDSIILVGHSLGGLHVRKFQSLFPEKVRGLVLLDAASSEQFKRLPEEFYEMLKNQPKQLDEVISLAQKGYLKYGKGKIPTFGLPKSLLDEYYKVATTPEYYYSMKMEVEAFEMNLKQSSKLNNLGDLPLLVIGSKNNMDKNILPTQAKNYPFTIHNKMWFELQKELALLSANSTFVASEKNHYLNLTDVDLVYTSITNWLNKTFE